MDAEQAGWEARKALLRREQALARDLAKLYQHAEATMKARIGVLMQQLETAQLPETREGKHWAIDRLNALLSQMQAEMRLLARKAATRAERAKLDNAEAAAGDGKVLASAMGFGASWTVLPAPALRELATRSMGETPLGKLFADIGPNASEAMRGILFDGIAQGQHPRIMAKAMDKAVENLTRDRAILIARTESMRAYRESAISGYAANKDILKGWRWTAARSERTCIVCLALDGRIFDHGEPFGSHPACFLPGTEVSGPKVLASSTRWYSGEIVEIHFSNGHHFAVTKNHPILTAKGWIAAGLLQDGDDVVSYDFRQRPFEIINPDDYQVPALIEEVARAVGEGGEAFTGRIVPTTAEDFHGDGINGDVCIIRTDSLLKDAMFAAQTQPRFEQSIIDADLNTLASSIPADDFFFVKVVSSTTRMYSGHVYNLQTSENWYSANGIIAHNCRCVPTPVSVVDLGETRKTGAEWFAEQDQAHQVKLLGPAKYQLYQAGHLTLPDLVDRHETKWGPTAAQKSIAQLVQDGVITRDQAGAALTRKARAVSSGGSAPTPRKPIAFKPAPDVNEAQAYAISFDLAKTVVYKNIDVAAANALNAGIEETRALFPLKPMDFIGSSQARNAAWARDHRMAFGTRAKAREAIDKKWPIPDHEYASSVGAKGYRGITFNEHSFNSERLAATVQLLSHNAESGFHPTGCSTIKSVVDHELGHQIESILPAAAHKEIAQIYTHLGYNAVHAGLSEYAAKHDVSEFIAEAWAEYRNNPHPRAIAKQIAAILLRYKKP